MITLSVNKFLATLTNLIAYAQVAFTHERGRVGDFVSSFQDINVDNGDGKVILAADLLEVDDLADTSDLLEVKKPEKTDEQYISVTNYKRVKMSINRYLMRGAFVNEEQLADFLGYLMSIMEATKTAYLSDELIKKLCEYEPAQETQKKTIELINTTGLNDPMQLEAANRYNANKIQKEFIKILNGMSFPTDKYNDLKYRDTLDFESLKLIIREAQNAGILVDSLAFLLNSDKITEAQRWDETFAIPDEQFDGKGYDDKNYIAWLMHKKKLQFGYFYNVATSFFDASTLNEQDFLHFSYYLDIVKAYPAVCFKISATLTPKALTAGE